MTFSFTADSSGSKDACTIPKGAQHRNAHRLRIRPPLGHSWSYARPNAASQSVQMGMDEELILDQKAIFYEDEIPLYIALDSGSGPFTGSLE